MIASIAELDSNICSRVALWHGIKVNLQWQYERGEAIIIVGGCADEVSEAVKETIKQTVLELFPLTIRRISTVPF